MELNEQNSIRDAHQEMVQNKQTDSVAAYHTEQKTSLLYDEHRANSGGQQNDAGSGGKTFEDIFHMVGRRGRFQILLLIIVILTNANVNMINVNTVFTLMTPEHRCKVPGLQGYNFTTTSDSESQVVDRYIPRGRSGKYWKCQIMSGLNDTELATDVYSKRGVAGNLSSCSEWVYDQSVMKRTLVSKLDLVCERKVIRSHVNMVLFVGKMAAGFLQGILSDHLGRRPCLILSCLGMLGCAIGSAFVYNAMTLLVVRFMAGFFATCLYLSVYVLGIEFLTIQQRSLLANCTRIVFSVSDLYMALMAYLLRDWQYLLLAIAWPSVFAAIFCWFMPESPRWLISKNGVEKAEREVQRIGKMNGKSVPKGIMRHLKQTDDPGKHTILQLFGSVGLTVRWIILYINWIVICMSVFGLAFNISNMGGNIFVNFAISGLLDAGACLLSSFIVNKLSRKYFYFGCSIFGACTCVMTFLPIILDAPNWCVVALSLIGKASIVAAFPLLYTYSAELYPTTHRGTGVGSCSMMARIGGLISSYVADASLFFDDKMATVLPQLVFGTCGIIGSLLILTLPETRDAELPATVDDIRVNPRNSSKQTSSNDKATFA